jgi:creatinine amidohydrolase
VFISTATSTDEAARKADVAVLPVGSFEQHGDHLPLATDTLIASLIAQRVAKDYNLFLLPPITLSCSHEHSDFAGTVSISSTTLQAIINDVMRSLEQTGIHKLAIINGHGGNYVLSNVVQEANVGGPRMILFPHSSDWTDARIAASCETSNHDDMHGGEAETSILLAEDPELVRGSYKTADHLVDDRRHLLALGVSGYATSGIIGRPSLADPNKGHALLDEFSQRFKGALAQLR